MVETYIKRTCVKNGSKNSYRYGRSARIFTPPPDDMVDRRGEQLAKTEDWVGRSTNEVASSESPDDDTYKSRGWIHRYIVTRDEHRTRIIAQRSEDNGTRPCESTPHVVRSRSMDQYLRTDISRYMYSQPDRSEIVAMKSWIDDRHVWFATIRFEQSDSKLFSIFSRANPVKNSS